VPLKTTNGTHMQGTKVYHKEKAPLSQGCESKAVSLLEFLAKSAADRETDRYLI
jgi:hypothetical protein